MKILTAAQIRQADQITLERQGIRSFELMQRAASACAVMIRTLYNPGRKMAVVCGGGNNGGDGYCIASDLFRSGYDVAVYEAVPASSPDCVQAKKRLQELKGIEWITSAEGIRPEAVIIDALFGTGLNRPVSGEAAAIIAQINQHYGEVVSIDLPSGMPADPVEDPSAFPIVQATHTLTFQCPKLSMLLPGCGPAAGEVHILDIGLDQAFIDSIQERFTLTDAAEIGKRIRKREKFAHKGNFGHALLIAGSRGKTGAVILAAKACLRSGAGLLTVHLPECGYIPMQTAVPEAMVSVDKDEEVITSLPPLERYSAIGVGPGLGTDKETSEVIRDLLLKINNNNAGLKQQHGIQQLVLDADALNIIATDPGLLKLLPKDSILTPHPGEFRRLAGSWQGDKGMLELAEQFAEKNRCIVVLKGHKTLITDGSRTWFNSTGNSGMAKGGSGDVLTGLITGLCASGYSALDAALTGVYFHGKAGDEAAKIKGATSMTAGDIAGWLRIGE